jgi:hypothetical protein
VKVYLENSIFFFHKAHPPSQRKAKSNPSAVSPRTTPQPRMERQPPRRLRPRPWERYSRPAIPATALPAAARTRTLRPAPPAACAPTRCSPHRACRRGERATCLPPFTPSHLRLAPRLHPATRAPRRLVISRCASGDILSLGAQSDMKIKPNSAPGPAK